MNLTYLSLWLAAAAHGVHGRVTGRNRERGDVPGWVMITVMTAALVIAILVPFRTAIVSAVQSALSNVTSTAGTGGTG
jgi:hypothetical protein